jgi:hypothetical protein
LPRRERTTAKQLKSREGVHRPDRHNSHLNRINLTARLPGLMAQYLATQTLAIAMRTVGRAF